jgi:hypothetical protein
LTAGGNDNKVYLFSTESGQPLWRCQLQSWINTVSVSDDGEYVAAGTGTSVYFYETGDEPAGPVLECQTIYEPMPIEDLAAFGGEKEDESYLRELRSGILGLVDRVINFIKKLVFRVKVGGPTTAVDEREREIENPGVCGNTLCEPDLGESRENCPRDCTGED